MNEGLDYWNTQRVLADLTSNLGWDRSEDASLMDTEETLRLMMWANSEAERRNSEEKRRNAEADIVDALRGIEKALESVAVGVRGY